MNNIYTITVEESGTFHREVVYEIEAETREDAEDNYNLGILINEEELGSDVSCTEIKNVEVY